MLALTFGVWAIIWIINAYTVLSKGSTIKKYTLNFLICLVFVLFYSLCDMAILVFNLGQTWVFVKDIFLIFLYTTFVFAAYRIYRIGKEFGFAEEASRIKELLKARRRY